MSIRIFLFTMLLLYTCLDGFTIKRSRKSIIKLDAKRPPRHLGTGGMFQDQFKRLKDPKLAKLYKDIDLDPKVLKNEDPQTKMVTGDELRKDRERDNVLVKQELDIIEAAWVSENGPRITQIPKRRKRTTDSIYQIVETLNALVRSKEKLTESERAGLIDFSEFDKFAPEFIPNYECGTPMAKSTHSWISYHRKKRDLRLVTTDLSSSFEWTYQIALGGLAGNAEKKKLAAEKKAEKNTADIEMSQSEFKRLAAIATT